MAVSLTWTVTVTNTSDTAATVKVVLKAKSTNGSYNLNNPSGYITIDGTKYTFNHDFSKNTTTTLATKSKSIGRTTASKSVAIKAYFKTGVSSGNISKSGSATVSARPVYTVYFNNGYSGTHSTASVFSGYTTTFPYISRTGYTFGSWSGYAQGATTPAITSSRTYTASWTAINYSISYTLNGGSISGQPTSYTVASGTITLPQPTRTGYHFTGWTGTNGTTPQTDVKIPSSSTGNRSYTANWEINTYNLILDAGEGTVSPTTIVKTHDVEVNLPENPIYPGHIFAGWSYNDNNIGTVCPANINGTTHNQNITITAVWSNAVRPVKLHYYYSINDIDSVYQIYKVIDTAISTLPNPIITNYKFKGWYSDTNFTTQVTSIPNTYDYPEDDPRYDDPEPIDLYAKWNKTYTIVFNANTPSYNDGIEVTGTINSHLNVEDGVADTIPAATEYTYVDSNNEAKCEAIGWSLSPTATTASYTTSFTPTGQAAGYVFNLYAVWQPKKFTTNFTVKSGEGSGSYSISNQDYYTTINFPNQNTSGVSRTNYYLSGWKSQGAAADDPVYNIGEPLVVTTNKTFEAQWINSYNVPILTPTVRRTLDEDAEIDSESGRFIEVAISGLNGSYIIGSGAVTADYSYQIHVDFFDDSGGIIDTIDTNYDVDTQVVERSRIILDKRFRYASCVITFIDTSTYGSYEITEENRTLIYNLTIPLKRGIGVHIADDLSAISLFDELDEKDEGLIVNKPISMNRLWIWKVDAQQHLYLEWIGGDNE